MLDVSKIVTRVLNRYPDADPHDVESACWRAQDRVQSREYVYRAGVNAAIDAYRSRSRRADIETAYSYLSGSTVTTPEDIIIVRALLTSPVARLLYAGYTQEEIATDLGKTRHQVRQELAKLRESCRG